MEEEEETRISNVVMFVVYVSSNEAVEGEEDLSLLCGGGGVRGKFWY